MRRLWRLAAALLLVGTLAGPLLSVSDGALTVGGSLLISGAVGGVEFG